jgi:hypothetical protein
MTEALGEAIGTAPKSLTPDAVASLLDRLVWTRIELWEEYSDLDLAKAIGLTSAALEGSILVVTEVSFARGLGAFMLPASQIERFVSAHCELFGESFFNGDVIVLHASTARLWMFHHEGVFSVADLPSGGPSIGSR